MLRFSRFISRRIVCIILPFAAVSVLLAAEKIKITRVEDLPAHSYKVTGKAVDIVFSDAKFAEFAAIVRNDIESELAKFDIEDRAALRRLHVVLLRLDMLEGKDKEALDRAKLLDDLEDKPAAKLTDNLFARAVLAARLENNGAQPAEMRPAFHRHLKAEMAALPYDIAGDTIKENMGMLSFGNEFMLRAALAATVEPALAKTGSLDARGASALINMRYALRLQFPLKEDSVAVYQKYLDENQASRKSEIWASRNVVLPAEGKYTPVVLGIWDSGVDVDLFKGQFLGGIAYDLDCERSPDMLMPLGDAKRRLPESYRFIKGTTDLRLAIDSPEARECKAKFAALKPDEFKQFAEDMQMCGEYLHGTHVAGIAMEGNPWARLVVGRFTEDYHLIARPHSIDRINAMARGWQETVDYFKLQHVRVVNMSWLYDLAEVKNSLEANGVGKDAADRAALAQKILSIAGTELMKTLNSAPDILFVAAAGNANDNVAFDEMIPASFDLPNLLVIGAVDQAGGQTGFTSYGKTVHVYADGFEIESVVPGGQKLKLSGTSMAAPAVTNLAGKMLALQPSLKPAEVIALIEKSATPAPDTKKPISLIDPKRTLSPLAK